jgi:hypothetical protein
VAHFSVKKPAHFWVKINSGPFKRRARGDEGEGAQAAKARVGLVAAP